MRRGAARRPAGSGRNRLPALALLGMLAAVPAAATDIVPIRTGNHPDRGRVALDWPERPTYRFEESRGSAVLRFPREVSFTEPRQLPRNVLGIFASGDSLTITFRPGARPRHFREGNMVVLDVLDPAPPPAQVTRPARPPAATAPATVPASEVSPPTEAAPALPPPAASVARVAPDVPASPPTAVAPPVLPPRNAVAVRLVSPPGRGRAMSLRLPEAAGLAVLRRGDALLVVVDVPVPLDLAALRGDPVLGAADVIALPEATVLRLRLAAPAVLVPRREGESWTLEPARDAAPGRSILPEPEGEALTLRAARPNGVVTLEDPETGLPLLVGTVAEAEQSSPQIRRLPRAELLPTLLGAAVLARGDGVSLRAAAGRFVVDGAGAGGVGLSGAVAAATAMTRLLDLPALPAAAAAERLRTQQAGLGGVAPLQRAPLRLAAAESLLALGLPQEAQSMMRLAFAEDPRTATEPRAHMLQGAAALLAGRVAEAGGLDDPSLPRTDETTLWRALLRAARGERTEAAQGLAATLPLLLSYPEPLRDRLVLPAVEALAEGGERTAARRLIEAVAGMPDIAYARGRLAETEGRVADALAAYDEAAGGRNRQLRARALRRAVEVRLASGALDAAGAATALEPALFAWRGDAEEAEARVRLAELRQMAGNPRGALTLLKETVAAFPERADALRPALRAALLSALERESPLVAVSLAEAHRDLLPSDAQGKAALLLLADRLVALDLPARASAILDAALSDLSGEPRAAIGARLAALRLGERDGPGAAAALSRSEAAELPGPLAMQRAILSARATAMRGDEDGAIAALRTLGPAGLPTLAEMLAGRRDWTGAADAMAALAAQPGEVDDPKRRTVVRAAAFTALSGDGARLGALRQAWAARLGEGPLRDAFLTLTADPVRGVADLPRLQRELDLFRGFPSRLEALRAEAPPTR